MQRWVNLLETNCNPNKETEYNAWYDGTHIPDVLKTPGFVRARRYQIKDFRDGRGKYMAIYDIETDDFAATWKTRLARREEETRQGRSSVNRPNFSYSLWRDVAWEEIARQSAPQNSMSKSGRWVNLVEQDCDPEREDEYHDWYNNLHVPDVLKTPGFVSATRYRAREFRDGRGKYLAIYEIETDDIEATMKLRLETRLKEVAAGRASANRPNLVRPLWRDVLWRQISEHAAER